MYAIRKALARQGVLQASLESLDYQKDHRFFDELTAAVARLRVGRPTPNAIEVAGLTDVINHHTGLALDSVFLADIYEAGIELPLLDARSPLEQYIPEGMQIPDERRPGLNHTALKERGTVDLEKARVTGVFSRVRGTLYLGGELFEILNDREIAAVVLHEVGHMFVSFEYLVHSAALAANLNYCASALAKTNDKLQRVEIIVNSAKGMGISVQDPEGLAMGKDPVVITVMLESYTRQVRTATGAPYYDHRTCEALADQFATRQGAGTMLVIALDKLNRSAGYNMLYSNKAGYKIGFYLIEILKTVCLGGIVAAGVVAEPAILVITALAMAIGLALPFTPEGEYDTLKGRYTRVRNELVGALKDRSLRTEQATTIHKDLEVLDQILKQTDERSTFFETVWRLLTRYRRENYRQVQIQAELERLANNDLFLAASKLHTIANS